MKSKLVLFLVLLCSLCGVSFAYTPSAKELKQVILLRQTLNELTSGNLQDKRSYYTQLTSLKEQFAQDPRLVYVLGQVADTLVAPIFAAKETAKTSSRAFKQSFVDQYATGLQTIPEKENCT